MNPRYTFIFFPVAALEQAACSPKTGRDTKRNGFQKLFLFLLLLGLQEYRFQCSIAPVKSTESCFSKEQGHCPAGTRCFVKDETPAVKGVVGAPLFVKFVTSRGVLRKAPSWKILLVGKSLQVIWILNSL